MKLRLTGMFAWLWILATWVDFVVVLGILKPLLFLFVCAAAFAACYGAQQLWRRGA